MKRVNLVCKTAPRHVTFPVFIGIPIFRIFFAGKYISEIHVSGMGTYYLHVLLHRGVPDLEIIYFVSIRQKKYNFLQKLQGVLVNKKDEVICSANK